MSVQRYDLNKCIGCKMCEAACPMDVFHFDEAARRSVISYPENCQSCGQCFVNCMGYSLTIVDNIYGYAMATYHAVYYGHEQKNGGCC